LEIKILCFKKTTLNRFNAAPKILSANLHLKHIGKNMVYCTKCGTQNADTAVNCSNCGAPLQSTYGANPQDWHYYRHQHRHYDHDYNIHRRSGGVGLLIAGLIIVALGLALLYDSFGLFIMYFWPIVLVVLGIWLLIRGLMWSQRRYR
jgi:hypothetical protein